MLLTGVISRSDNLSNYEDYMEPRSHGSTLSLVLDTKVLEQYLKGKAFKINVNMVC